MPLRRATAADVPELAALLQAAYRENEALGVEYHAPAVSEERVRRYVERAEVWVLEEDGRLVASVGLRPKVEVQRLAVAPDARGRGLAAELLAFAERRGGELGHDEAELDVDGDHPWLQGFYARRGWSEAARLRFPEWEGWEVVRFRKRLGRSPG